VIRLAMYIRKPFLDRVAFNKKNILRRDATPASTANRRGERLTVDHVVPRSRGGETSWVNVVAACLRCNLRKGNRLADEVGMRLIREPVHPKFVFSTHMLRIRTRIRSWTRGENTSSRFRRLPDVARRRVQVVVRIFAAPATSRRPSQPSRASSARTGHMVLRGVTGSGKTYSIANVVANVDRPDPGQSRRTKPWRPALQRVPGLLPDQRRRVLRVVLRLLPARG